jgi:AraC-like DNA-binding protein
VNPRLSEYRPSLPLRSLVQSYWTGDFNLYSENQFVQTVVPNGCIELIIHLTREQCELVKDNEWGKTPESMFIGLRTSAYNVRFDKLVRVFGIRFFPEGFYAAFGVSPSHFTHSFEDCRDVLGQEFSEYCCRLRDLKDARAQVELTENYLLKMQSRRSAREDYLRLAPVIIRRNNGTEPLESVLKQLPVSLRQLQRGFKEKFGITAKEYTRLVRMNAIQKYMQSAMINLTDLTYEIGFADQSHFIREFKLITGISPRKFLDQRSEYIVNPAEED